MHNIILIKLRNNHIAYDFERFYSKNTLQLHAREDFYPCLQVRYGPVLEFEFFEESISWNVNLKLKLRCQKDHAWKKAWDDENKNFQKYYFKFRAIFENVEKA